LSDMPEPKQERARRTRERLLRAACATLTERGYSGMSTALVAERAEVSQGALFRHFPSKMRLVAEATRMMFEELRDEYVDKFRLRAPDAGDLTTLGLTLLWDAFTDARVFAVYELYLAARHERELGERLQPILEEHNAAIAELAAALFPSAAGREDFESVVKYLLWTIQGAALMADVMNPGEPLGQVAEFLERIARSELGEIVLPDWN